MSFLVENEVIGIGNSSIQEYDPFSEFTKVIQNREEIYGQMAR